MTTELIALARAYMALPGVPSPGPMIASMLHMGDNSWRASDGIAWTRHGGEWLPDFTDRATGGVMLAVLPHPVKVTTRTEPVGCSAVYLTDDGEGLGPRQHTTGWRSTLAEAVARVAVALGRAG